MGFFVLENVKITATNNHKYPVNINDNKYLWYNLDFNIKSIKDVKYE